MRLLLDDGQGNLRLEVRDDDNIPRYAILSHTWGADSEEVTFRDLMEGTGKNKAGYDKIEFCRQQAASDGIHFFWVDTCCIDKSSSSELTEAINSMFRWYQNAFKCYVYLSDVSNLAQATNTQLSSTAWKAAFRESRWFSRGWTLQELIAPASVDFFSQEGDRLGSKTSLEQDIHDITGIPIAVLRGGSLAAFAAEERLSWANHRETKRQEDKAYSLLGIFDIHMSLIYGEGREKAFVRLREEIGNASKRKWDSYAGTRPFPEALEVASPKIRRLAVGHDVSLRLEFPRASSRYPKDKDFNPPRVLDTCQSDHRAEYAVRPSYYLPFPRNRRFVGRGAELEALTQKLFVAKDCEKLALVGLGGIGKTQVALEFAYTVKETRPEFSIFWVPALSVESFEQACADIARKLNIDQASDDKEDVKELVRKFLSAETAGRWLLIVDNADDKDVLYGSCAGGSNGIVKYLPESEDGLIVFTTRYQEAAVELAGGDVIELETMSRQEAFESLRKLLIRKDMLENEFITIELLDELTYLPLAISQAAAYLNTNKISIADYLGLLRNTEQDIIGVMSREFRDNTRYRGSKNAVATTWLVSFDQILRYDPTAADLLKFMSCIEPRAIPCSILPAMQPKERMVHAIGTLSGYAFLVRRGVEDMYDLHRLVHLATRVWVRKNGVAAEIGVQAIQHVAGVFPSDEYKNRESCREHLPHALKVLDSKHGEDLAERYDLCEKVGVCLHDEGRVRQAVRWLEETFLWRKENLGEEDFFRLSSQYNLAMAYLQDGQIGKSVKLFEQVVAVREKVLPENDPNLLASQNLLAHSYTENGQVDKAIKLIEHVTTINNKTLIKEHPNRLTSQHALAVAYLKDGQIDNAVILMEQVVAVSKKTLIEAHPDLLASQHSLAVAYQDIGQVNKAVELMEHVVEIGKKVFRDDHPRRLRFQRSLEWLYAELEVENEASRP